MNYLRKYKKYKNAGLPIMDFDGKSMHYLNFYKMKNNKGKEKINVFDYDLLSDALEDLLNEGFYYSFNTLICEYDEEGNETIKVGHSHAHNFESVVREVYYNPHVFSIDKEDKYLYSEQEYRFLMKIKSYLMAIKREDISFNATIDDINDMSLNEDACLFRDYKTFVLPDDKSAELMINKKKKYFISLNTNDNRYLLANNEGVYLGLIEVIKKKKLRIDDLTEKDVDYKLEGFKSLKAYQNDLKKFYRENFADFNDRTEIIVNTVKVIRKF